MWIFIIAFVGLIGWLLYKYGVFNATEIYEDKLFHPHLLYYSYRGKSQDVGKEFDTITSYYKDHFKISSFFGIYYTCPSDDECKAVLGILVN
jgi:hypothetical protein